MDNNLKKRNISRKRRVFRVRKKLMGTITKPRMCVNRTNKHLFIQLIDDENSNTIGSISTLSKEFKTKKSKKAASELGKKIAEIAKSKNINEVIFDRGKCKFHGILSLLAEAARSAGLNF
jgi:large subunit ribosomal protein L18